MCDVHHMLTALLEHYMNRISVLNAVVCFVMLACLDPIAHIDPIPMKILLYIHCAHMNYSNDDDSLLNKLMVHPISCLVLLLMNNSQSFYWKIFVFLTVNFQLSVKYYTIIWGFGVLG